MTALLTENLPLLAGAPNGIKKLRELILELAVRGKLVPQDPNDEPASELLKRIAEEKARLVAEGKIKKQKPLGEMDEEETPFDLPANWTWYRLGNLVTESGAGWSPSCEPRPREANEWGVLKVSAVSWGIYQPEENKALPASLAARPEHEVAEGDFLVSRANTSELVARSVVVETTPTHLMLSDKIVRLKLTSLCERRYVNLANSAPLARDYYSRVAGGTSSSMKNVSREQILHLPLALPPLAEQQRIVTKVDELMALCDRLEAQQSDAESAHAQLVQALLDSLTQTSDATDFATNWQRLAEYFHTLFTTEPSIDALKQTLLQLAVMGKLVPQDHNDEPAEDLYERIQSERQRLVKEGELRKHKPLAEIASEGIQLKLPSTWKWVPLLEITTGMDSGWSPSCLSNNSPSSDVWGVLKTTAVQIMRYLEHENKELPDHLEPRPAAEAKTGDILFTRAGPMNRVGISCLVESTRPKLMISDKIIRFHPVELGAYGRFIALCLNAGETAKYLEQAKSGMAASQVNISQEKLRMAPIPLAPFPEQHRIVAKVDQLMALCDQLKTRLTQARQLNEQLASTLVGQALA